MPEFFFHRLLAEPLVTVVASGRAELWPGIVHTGRLGAGREAHVLIAPSWHLTKPWPRIQAAVERARTEFPRFSFTILAQEEADIAFIRAAGLEAIYCHQNAFLDERRFYPEPNIPRLYDAVHNARLVPFKRHELAALVPRLALISGGYDVEADYAKAVLAGMADLAISNYRPDGGLQHLQVEQVRRILVRSHCGLALSAEEGGNYASAEYLLAGLPVVTTPSIGGRDAFFHPDYVATVEPTPEAVAAAVAAFKRDPIDPLLIRDRTLDLARAHRLRLIELLSGLGGYDFRKLADGSMWLPQFTHQLRGRVALPG